MKGQRLQLGLIVAVILALISGIAALQFSQSGSMPSGFAGPHQADFGQLPISFEPNVGQTSAPVRFVARAPGNTLFFAPAEVVLALAQPKQQVAQSSPDTPGFHMAAPAAPQDVHLQFLGATVASVEAGAPLPGRINYLLGDATRWHQDVPTYADIIYNNLYPGVNLRYEGNNGRLKSTYTIAPGGDVSRIRWRYAEAAVQVDGGGNLVVEVPGASGQTSTLTEQVPVAWQMKGTQQVAVPVRYAVAADSSIGFAVGSYDRTQPLIIDPTLLYSTYLGGAGTEYGLRIAIDAAGNMYVTGETGSLNFPTQNPYQPNNAGNSDVFVTKLNPTGSTLLYSTYLGGDNRDLGVGLGLDAANNIYIAGFTASTNFPRQNAYQNTYGGGAFDAFVTELNASGSALLYSTYLGGSGYDQVFDLAVDALGTVYLGGETDSPNFPLANAYQGVLRGFSDGFVTKVNTGGTSLAYSTYFGGSDGDGIYGLTVDGVGSAFVTGIARSTNFPLQNPYQPSFGGGSYDAFVTKFNPAGSGLIYSSYLGGSNDDFGESITVDGTGSMYLMGVTRSSNFPLQNPIQPTNHGGLDMFVTKLNAAGSALAYSTYLGGSGDERGSFELESIAVDSTGSAYVIGDTVSTDFPLANPIQNFNAGGMDASLTKLNSAGSAWVYSTYLGGNGDDAGYDVVLVGHAAIKLAFGAASTGSMTRKAHTQLIAA